MQYVLRYTKAAQADLACLDARIAGRIIGKLYRYVNTPDPMRYAKPLAAGLRGSYRFRIGAYRVVFNLWDQGAVILLEITGIGHRGNIYGR